MKKYEDQFFNGYAIALILVFALIMFVSFGLTVSIIGPGKVETLAPICLLFSAIGFAKTLGRMIESTKKD